MRKGVVQSQVHWKQSQGGGAKPRASVPPVLARMEGTPEDMCHVRPRSTCWGFKLCFRFKGIDDWMD